MFGGASLIVEAVIIKWWRGGRDEADGSAMPGAHYTSTRSMTKLQIPEPSS